MKKLDKLIRRLVTIRSSDRAMADRTFVVYISPQGIAIREFGDREADRMGISWRSVIGHILIHKGVIQPRVPQEKKT